MRTDGLTCRYPGCARTLASETQWRRLDATTRRTLQRAGTYRHTGRGLCQRCYSRAVKDGTVHDYERLTVATVDVLTEWEHAEADLGLAERRTVSMQERIRRLAPRLGMTADALEQALYRAGVRAETAA